MCLYLCSAKNRNLPYTKGAIIITNYNLQNQNPVHCQLKREMYVLISMLTVALFFIYCSMLCRVDDKVSSRKLICMIFLQVKQRCTWENKYEKFAAGDNGMYL